MSSAEKRSEIGPHAGPAVDADRCLCVEIASEADEDRILRVELDHLFSIRLDTLSVKNAPMYLK